MTLAYKTLEKDYEGEGYAVSVNEAGHVTRLVKTSKLKKGDRILLGSVLMDGNLFVAMVRRAFAQDPNQYLIDVLARNVSRPGIYGYEYLSQKLLRS